MLQSLNCLSFCSIYTSFSYLRMETAHPKQCQQMLQICRWRPCLGMTINDKDKHD